MGLDIYVEEPCLLQDVIPDKHGDLHRRVLSDIRDYPNGLEVEKYFRKYFKPFITHFSLDSLNVIRTLKDAGYNHRAYYFDEFEWDFKTGIELGAHFKNKSDSENTIFIPVSGYVKDTHLVAGFYYNEIGYQRKGQNQDFYRDSVSDNPFVFTVKDVLSHYEKYFDEQFGKNILSKFEEGRNFIYYSG